MTAQFVNNIAVSVASIHNLSILCYHCYHLLSCKSQRIQLLSVSTIFMACILSIYATLISWPQYPLSFIKCKWVATIGILIYQTYKGMIYILFLERLFLVFQQSTYKFSKSFIISSRAFIILFVSVCIVLIICITNGTIINETNACKADIPQWSTSIIIIADLIIMYLISTLFSRRLLLLSCSLTSLQFNNFTKHNKNNNKHDKTYDAYYRNVKIAKKSTLLTLSAILTTILSLIVIGFLGQSSMCAAIDSMVNCWCIMLMFAIHNKLYNIICGKTELLIHSKCLSCYSCNCCCRITINNTNNGNKTPHILSIPSNTRTSTNTTPTSPPQLTPNLSQNNHSDIECA